MTRAKLLARVAKLEVCAKPLDDSPIIRIHFPNPETMEIESTLILGPNDKQTWIFPPEAEPGHEVR